MTQLWKNVKDGSHSTVLFATGVLGVFADMNQTQGFRNILTSAITFVSSTGRQFDYIKHQYAKMVSEELFAEKAHLQGRIGKMLAMLK